MGIEEADLGLKPAVVTNNLDEVLIQRCKTGGGAGHLMMRGGKEGRIDLRGGGL